MRPVKSRQPGVVMIVCLLILLLTGLLAATVYEGNFMQLRMADNDEMKSRELQDALALVDGILANPDNFPLNSEPGYLLCHAGALDESCNETVVAVDPGLLLNSDAWDYFVLRRGPPQISLPAMAEARASSGRYYRGALFEIRVSRKGAGGVRLVQGVIRRQVMVGH